MPLSQDRCPFGLCDGSGFVVDEDTNTASDCRCRAQRVSRARAKALSGVIPRKYRGRPAAHRRRRGGEDECLVGELLNPDGSF